MLFGWGIEERRSSSLHDRDLVGFNTTFFFIFSEKLHLNSP
jgi:hypothetical protein